MTQSKASDGFVNLTVEELIALHEEIERLIIEKIEPEKKTLHAKLEAISRFEAKKSRALSGPIEIPASSSKRSRKLPPRYRNPSTGQTWTGRGLQPRWMREAIQVGQSKEDFLISG